MLVVWLSWRKTSGIFGSHSSKVTINLAGSNHGIYGIACVLGYLVSVSGAILLEKKPHGIMRHNLQKSLICKLPSWHWWKRLCDLICQAIEVYEVLAVRLSWRKTHGIKRHSLQKSLIWQARIMAFMETLVCPDLFIASRYYVIPKTEAYCE